MVPDVMDMMVTEKKSAQGITCQVTRMALVCLWVTVPAYGQQLESVGGRALGMGGAFVAVASDSSATWWNPAGLAAGPFVDLAWGKGLLEAPRDLPAWRDRTSWVALGTPPLGVGLYRFRITDIQPFSPTAPAPDDRQDTRGGVPLRSLAVTQFGVTLVRTVTQGVHAGTTLKYLRGTTRRGLSDAIGRPRDLLDAGESIAGGEGQSRFDLDLGLLGVAGPFRMGLLVRNLRQSEFGRIGDEPGPAGAGMRVPRQVRAGLAFDAEAVDRAPLTIALDGDLQAYDTPVGERQVVALGAERWFAAKRIGVRGGGRVNTRGARERAATAGATVTLRGGVLVDGYAVGAGADGEKGWGLAVRVSF